MGGPKAIDRGPLREAEENLERLDDHHGPRTTICCKVRYSTSLSFRTSAKHVLERLTPDSRRQYTAKLKSWNLQKNVPGEVMRLACTEVREDPQKGSFVYMGRHVLRKDLRRYQHRHRDFSPLSNSSICKISDFPGRVRVLTVIV